MSPRHSSERAHSTRTPRPARRVLGAVLAAGVLTGSSWGWGTLGNSAGEKLFSWPGAGVSAAAPNPNAGTTNSATGPDNSELDRYFGGRLPSFPGNPSADTATSNASNTSAASSQWSNPNARSTDPNFHVSLNVLELPRINGDVATFRLRLTNNRTTAITNPTISFAWREAAQIESLRVAQLANLGEYPRQGPAVELQGTIEPGQSRDITVELLGSDATTNNSNTVSAGDQVSLNAPGLTQPGARPIIFNAGGTLAGEDAPGGPVGSIAVARTAVSVASDKKSAPTPLTMLWPLAAQTSVVPGATGDAPTPKPLYLRNENLAKELGEGGRLRGLLDAYREAAGGTGGRELRAATCLAIDPELVNTVERMTHGYRVGQQVPEPVKEQRRLRDSWGELLGGDDDGSVAGNGVDAAKSWLDDLRELVKNGCSVALPYAGADINAVASAGDDWLGVQAFGMGTQIIKRVLGVVPQQNIVVPDSGYVSPEAVRMLAAGATQGIDADSSTRFEAMQAGLPALPAEGAVTALVADNTVQQSKTARQVEAGSAGTSGERAAEAQQNAAIDNSWNERITRLTSGSNPGGEAAPGGNEADQTTDRKQTQHDRAASQSHQYTTVSFSGNLGTLLQATGSSPAVAPYSNPESRYPTEADSSAARMGTALAGLDLEIAGQKPVLAVPPANWGVNKQEAAAVLQKLSQHLTRGSATPAPLSRISTPRGDLKDEELAQGSTTVPYGDPGASSPALTSFVGNIAGQVRDVTQFMRNDPKIVLQREVFTRPLFADLVRSLSDYSMRVRSQWEEQRKGRVSEATRVADVTDKLHKSVTLVPPGNVFTRTSDSSPLIVVARNGLPLPVRAKLEYSADETSGVSIDVPEAQDIPARGSITMSLTTEMPADGGAEQMELWLATTDDTRISTPVQLRVQSTPGVRIPVLLIAGAVVLAIAITARLPWVRRSGRRGKNRLVELTSRPVNR